MKIRRIRWGYFSAGITVLAVTLFFVIYMPTGFPRVPGGKLGRSLAFLVSIFGEFAGRYYYFLLPALLGVYLLREAFRDQQERVTKP